MDPDPNEKNEFIQGGEVGKKSCWKGGGTSADSFPKVSKILYMAQMVLPDEIESYFFTVKTLSYVHLS